MKLILMCLFFLMVWTANIFASNDLTVVKVGQAELENDKIIFLGPEVDKKFSSSDTLMISEFLELARNNFSFYKKRFEVINPPQKRVEASNAKFWQLLCRYLVVLDFEKKAGNVLHVKIELFDVSKNTPLYTFRGDFTQVTLRKFAHQQMNAVYKSITGRDSIFESVITYVSDKPSRGEKVIKELYIMDFDGHGKRKLTNHGGIVVSPAISFGKDQILYSLLLHQGVKTNPNLYVYNMKTGKSSIVSSRKGMNSGAIFLPGDKEIILTLGQSGDAEIYKMNLQTKELTQITRNSGHDVDPSITANGELMAFLSNRPGSPEIYTLDPRGVETSVKRISFVGDFNATPRFSPDGSEMVFASWLENCFDIFRINSDGNGLVRLTRNFGSNEDPTYSNDGQFIAFSSQRVLSRTKAVHNIYIMDRDGEMITAITKDDGNCISPRWSK